MATIPALPFDGTALKTALDALNSDIAAKNPVTVQRLTQAQYDALTTTQKNDATILYLVAG